MGVLMAANNTKISKEEFIKNYLAKGIISKEDWDRLGLIAVPCDCELEYCKGWIASGDFSEDSK